MGSGWNRVLRGGLLHVLDLPERGRRVEVVWNGGESLARVVARASTESSGRSLEVAHPAEVTDTAI